MKRGIWLLVAVSALPLAAQEAPKAKSASEQMMAMHVEMAKPVAEHQRLTELEGKWNVTTKLWLDPAAEPMTATGTAVGKRILGGRFVQVDGTMGGAMPAEMLTIYGFDRRTNDYTLVGYDTLGTYYITAAGKEDGEKRVLLDGEYIMPPGSELQKYRFVWTRPSATEHLMVLYFEMNGQMVRIAETTMARGR